MTDATIDTRDNGTSRPATSNDPAGSALYSPPSAVPVPDGGAVSSADADRRRRAMIDRPFPVAPVIAASVAVHLIAAALIYRHLVRDLYALFDATPRLLVLEHGLTRLTAVAVFLPPVIPTVLVVVVALWLGKGRQVEGVSQWLALAVVPLAIDSAMRCVGVLLAASPSTIGELLDLPSRFAIGPRLLLDLADVHPGPAASYWAVVCTAAAVLSAWCVGRAVLVAESAEREARTRRRRGHDAIESLQVGIAVAGAWVAIGFAGQVALPFATQLFLKLFG